MCGNGRSEAIQKWQHDFSSHHHLPVPLRVARAYVPYLNYFRRSTRVRNLIGRPACLSSRSQVTNWCDNEFMFESHFSWNTIVCRHLGQQQVVLRRLTMIEDAGAIYPPFF